LNSLPVKMLKQKGKGNLVVLLLAEQRRAGA
jgi:hypothetical protein